MNLDEAQALAHQHLDRHGLTDRGWTFRFDTAVKRLGATRHGRREISLSRVMVEANDQYFVRQVLLHEIAHALLPDRRQDGSAYGHGHEWRRVARELGYRGGRTMGDLPGAETGPRPRVGHSVETVDGKHLGTVVKHGRTRIHFRSDDGRVWSAAFAHVVRVEPAAPRTGQA